MYAYGTRFTSIKVDRGAYFKCKTSSTSNIDVQSFQLFAANRTITIVPPTYIHERIPNPFQEQTHFQLL